MSHYQRSPQFRGAKLELVLSFAERYFSEKQEKMEFYVWLDNDRVFRMWFEVVKSERIETAVGDISQVKVRLVPDIRSIMPVGNLLASLIQLFVPGVVFTVNENGDYVTNAEGMFGPPGSPKMRFDVISSQIKRQISPSAAQIIQNESAGN